MNMNQPTFIALCLAGAVAFAPAQDATPPARPQFSPEQIFKFWDKNGDGKLTPDEVPNANLFKMLDKNGDGVVTKEEAATIGDYERLCLMILNRGELDGVRVLKPETVDLIFENHLKHPTMKYGLGGIVNGAGSYGWGGADGTQFVIDGRIGSFTHFMVQTQHYKAPT